MWRDASFLKVTIPANIYQFKVNNSNTKTRCEICSKLTIETPERRSVVFLVNFEHISHPNLVVLLLTLNMQLPAEISLKNNDLVGLSQQFCG